MVSWDFKLKEQISTEIYKILALELPVSGENRLAAQVLLLFNLCWIISPAWSIFLSPFNERC